MTDANGTYSFDVALAGIYTVTVVPPANYIPTTVLHAELAVGADSVLSSDFGFFQTGEIHGQAFQDLDSSGSRDPGEPALSGQTIFLDSNINGILDAGDPSTATDTNGNYMLSGIGFGSHVIRTVAPIGWAGTSPVGPGWSVSLGGDFESNIGPTLSISDSDDGPSR